MKNSRLFVFGGVAIAGLMVFLGYFWFVRAKVDNWTPTNPEPPAKVFFKAKWGFMGIGFYKASGKDEDVLNEDINKDASKQSSLSFDFAKSIARFASNLPTPRY